MLLVEGRFGYASNALRNEFVDAVRAGGFLSRETRQEALDGLADNNRFGQELGGGLVFLGCDSLFGKPWLQGQVALSHTDIVGGRFTRTSTGWPSSGTRPTRTGPPNWPPAPWNSSATSRWAGAWWTTAVGAGCGSPS